MCTATWLRNDPGYDLFFNRDERHTRKPAIAPEIRESNGVRFIAPTDGDHGGTWIAINQFGLSLCLLNAYDKQTTLTDRCFTSRGGIVLDLVDSQSLFEVKTRLSDKDLTSFQPFRLLGISTDGPAMLVEWDGTVTRFNGDAEDLIPLSSSSFDTSNVVTGRRKLYKDLISGNEPSINSLRSFHRSHIPFQSAYSVCVHRDDAQTVSFSQISVSGDVITLSYFPDSPCLYSQEKVQSTRLSLLAFDWAHKRQAKVCTLNSAIV